MASTLNLPGSSSETEQKDVSVEEPPILEVKAESNTFIPAPVIQEVQVMPEHIGERKRPEVMGGSEPQTWKMLIVLFVLFWILVVYVLLGGYAMHLLETTGDRTIIGPWEDREVAVNKIIEMLEKRYKIEYYSGTKFVSTLAGGTQVKAAKQIFGSRVKSNDTGQMDAIKVTKTRIIQVSGTTDQPTDKRREKRTNKDRVTSQNKVRVTSQNKDRVTSHNKNRVTSGSEVSATSQNEDSVTSSENKDSITSENEDSITSENEDMVTSENEVSATSQNEDSVTSSENEDMVTSENEVRVTLERKIRDTSQNNDSSTLQNKNKTKTQNGAKKTKISKPKLKIDLDEILLFFEKRVVEKRDSGWKTGYATLQLDNWTLQSACLYVASVITTVGYGDIVPSSNFGRGFTIVYSLIGIPLTLIVISIIGMVLAQFFRALVRLTSKSAVDPVDGKVYVPLSLSLAILFVYLCIGAGLFCYLTSWNILTAFYFCYITLTTIGLGDFVFGSGNKYKTLTSADMAAGTVHAAGDKADEFSNAVDPTINNSAMGSIIYLLVGLSLVSMCFTLMQEEVARILRRFIAYLKNKALELLAWFFRKICCCCCFCKRKR